MNPHSKGKPPINQPGVYISGVNIKQMETWTAFQITKPVKGRDQPRIMAQTGSEWISIRNMDPLLVGCFLKRNL